METKKESTRTLILGKPYSGKSFISRAIMKQYDNPHIFSGGVADSLEEIKGKIENVDAVLIDDVQKPVQLRRLAIAIRHLIKDDVHLFINTDIPKRQIDFELFKEYRVIDINILNQ